MPRKSTDPNVRDVHLRLPIELHRQIEELADERYMKPNALLYVIIAGGARALAEADQADAIEDEEAGQ